MAHDVFISHSTKDKQTADAACAVLESKSIRCWVAPRDIQPGADWGESIIKAIRDSRVMVLIFSQNANDSVQIKREVERAVHHAIPVIPVRTEDILPTGALEYSISTAHWLDAFPPPMERHFDYLARTVSAILEGKAQPPKPSPVPRPVWVKLAFAGAALALTALLIYLAIKFFSPPSLQGTWDLKDCKIASAQNSVLSELISAALTGHDVKGKMEIQTLNQYSASLSASDRGTVRSTGPVNAPGGISSSALTFTSDSTHKPVVLTYQIDLENNGQWNSFGVPAGEKILMFGVNAGGAEVLLHGTQAQESGAGKVDPAVVGTWAGTPFNLNPPDNLWSGALTIQADGYYLLVVTHQETGLLDAEKGTWSGKRANSWAPGQSPIGGPYNGIFLSGHYSFSGSNRLNLVTGDGSFTFERAQ